MAKSKRSQRQAAHRSHGSHPPAGNGHTGDHLGDDDHMLAHTGGTLGHPEVEISASSMGALRGRGRSETVRHNQLPHDAGIGDTVTATCGGVRVNATVTKSGKQCVLVAA